MYTALWQGFFLLNKNMYYYGASHTDRPFTFTENMVSNTMGGSSRDRSPKVGGGRFVFLRFFFGAENVSIQI